jgi:hypothetical protein
MIEIGNSETRSSFDSDMKRVDQDELSPLQNIFPVEGNQCNDRNPKQLYLTLAQFYYKNMTEWLRWY